MFLNRQIEMFQYKSFKLKIYQTNCLSTKSNKQNIYITTPNGSFYNLYLNTKRHYASLFRVYFFVKVMEQSDTQQN